MCARMYARMIVRTPPDTRPRPEHDRNTTGTRDTTGKETTQANKFLRLVGDLHAKNEKKLKKVCKYGKSHYLCNRNQITNKYNNKIKAI